MVRLFSGLRSEDEQAIQAPEWRCSARANGAVISLAEMGWLVLLLSEDRFSGDVVGIVAHVGVLRNEQVVAGQSSLVLVGQLRIEGNDEYRLTHTHTHSYQPTTISTSQTHTTKKS
jgi:hypothetical protein